MNINKHLILLPSDNMQSFIWQYVSTILLHIDECYRRDLDGWDCLAQFVCMKDDCGAGV